MGAVAAACAMNAAVVLSAAPATAGQSRCLSSSLPLVSVEDMDDDDDVDNGGGSLWRCGQWDLFVIVIVKDDKEEDKRIANEKQRGGKANLPIGGGCARTAGTVGATNVVVLVLVGVNLFGVSIVVGILSSLHHCRHCCCCCWSSQPSLPPSPLPPSSQQPLLLPPRNHCSPSSMGGCCVAHSVECPPICHLSLSSSCDC